MDKGLEQFVLAGWWGIRQSGIDAAGIADTPGDLGVHLELVDGRKVAIRPTDSVVTENGLKLISENTELAWSADTAEMAYWNTLVVPPILDYRLTLADGTKVWLNAASSLRFPTFFSDSTREVFLTGEAYFEVTENKRRPFVVHTESNRVTVLGTAFNINAYDKDKIETSLVNGKVMTEQRGVRVTLHPGQSTYFMDGDFRTSSFDTRRVLSWMDGVYHFNRTGLTEISAVLARWYAVELVIDNPALMEKTFSGAIFKAQPLDVFLENLGKTSGVQARMEPTNVKKKSPDRQGIGSS